MEVVILKFKKLLLTSIIMLAILTIGCASASQNSTQNDQITLQNETDLSDVLSEGYFWDDDFYLTVNENYSQDLNEWDSNELIYISSNSQKNGTFKVSVDDTEKASFNITNGYFSVEDDGNGGTYNKSYKYLYPKDIGIENTGSYNIKIRFNDTTLIDTLVTLKEKEDFDIWMQNPYYCEEEYWTVLSFIAIDSNHQTNGVLEIYVNGTRKISYNVTDGQFEEITGCSNKSRYLSASDLIESYGTYRIQINFTQNGLTKMLRDENVVVAEFEPTVNPKIEVYLDLYTVNLPADNIAHIYLPREANGTLTVSYNNVNGEKIKFSKGQASYYIYAWNLNHLGVNTLTFTYVGDDFGTLTADVNCTVVPSITAPDYVSIDEEFNISMITHDWVNGNFNVYDYNNGTKGVLLASNSIVQGLSKVSLSGSSVGLNKYYLEFIYPGGDYPLIKEVYVVKNSENINVDVSDEVEVGSPFNITINAPDVDFTFAQVSVDAGDVEFLMFESGEVKKTITFLTAGYHTIKVFCDNSYYAGGEWIEDIYLNTFTVNAGVKTNINVSDLTCDYGDNLTIVLKDVNGNVLSGKELVINVDGKNYNKTTDDNGQVIFTVNLSGGNYTANIRFSGDEGYLSSFADSKISVNNVDVDLNVDDLSLFYGDSLIVTLKDVCGNILTNKTLFLNFNATEYNQTTNETGQASFDLGLIPGNYTFNITFKGDNTYNELSRNADVEIVRAFLFLEDCSGNLFYGGDNYVLLDLVNLNNNLSLAKRNVIINFKGNDTNLTSDENGFVKFKVDLPAGNYSANLRMVDDNLFNVADNGTFNFTIFRLQTRLSFSNVVIYVTKTGHMIASLEDIKGNPLSNKTLRIIINGNNYTGITNSSGQTVVFFEVDKSNCSLKISFEGDENYVESEVESNMTFKRMSILTAENVTAYYNSGGKLIVSLSDYFGSKLSGKKINIRLDNQNITKITDSNGQVAIPINLNPGRYTAYIDFEGDDEIENSSTNAIVTVTRSGTVLTAAQINTVYNVAENLIITLKDAGGNALSSKKIYIKIDKKTFDAVTDNNGQAVMSINLPANSYTAEIEFNGDDYYTKSAGNVKIIVNKAKPKLTARLKTFKLKTKNKKFKATLKDNLGHVMKNTKLTLKVKGKKYTAKTNKKGVATFKVKLNKKGYFRAKISFKGNTNYKTVSKTVKIKVKR